MSPSAARAHRDPRARKVRRVRKASRAHKVRRARRVRQVQRVLQVQDILRLLAEGSSPIVLMGDFNAGSTSDELAPLYTRLRDVWREAGAGSGNTSAARLSGDPTGRIDYIFVSPGIAISSVSVPIDAQTRLASDHYPVVANIAVPGSQPGPGLFLH